MLNFDFATNGHDEPFTTEEMAAIQAFRDRVVTLSGNPNPSPREFARYTQRGTRAEFPGFIGTPSRVADLIEEWFGSARDGFAIAGGHVPGSRKDCVRLVAPDLQRRGLFDDDHAGATWRENLAIPTPRIGR